MRAIFNAFCGKIATFAISGSPSLNLPVSYPGIAFTPPDTGQWLEVLAFWNGGGDLGLEAGSDAYDQGFFRVMICGRTGAGLGKIQDIADDLRGEFPINTKFGGARTERTPTFGGPITDDARKVIYIPMTVRWRSIR